MRVAIGLGNPGVRYVGTRHNVGFAVLDQLAVRWQISEFWRPSKKGLLNITRTAQGERVAIFKPQTFMNLSGQAVQPLLHYHRVPLHDALVVTDDVELPAGRVRWRINGRDGGHRGLRSIHEALGTDQYKRLRIGVGRPRGAQALKAYVLDRFSPQEQQALESCLALALEKVQDFLETGAFENGSANGSSAWPCC